MKECTPLLSEILLVIAVARFEFCNFLTVQENILDTKEVWKKSAAIITWSLFQGNDLTHPTDPSDCHQRRHCEWKRSSAQRGLLRGIDYIKSLLVPEGHHCVIFHLSIEHTRLLPRER